MREFGIFGGDKKLATGIEGYEAFIINWHKENHALVGFTDMTTYSYEEYMHLERFMQGFQKSMAYLKHVWNDSQESLQKEFDAYKKTAVLLEERKDNK
jgi:hypothetical protein